MYRFELLCSPSYVFLSVAVLIFDIGPVRLYLRSIWSLSDDLRCHPVWRPHQRLPFGDVFANLGAEAKVRQLYLQKRRGLLQYSVTLDLHR